MIAAGLWENLLQALVQGLLAGPGAIYLFVRVRGAARRRPRRGVSLAGAAFTLLIGWLALGEVPSLWQVLGFAVVLIGFRLTQRM